MKRRKPGGILIGARVAVVLFALVLCSADGFALDAKPDLTVLVFGAGSDPRPVTAPGQPFSFGIGLDNVNAAQAHQVRLTAALPEGLRFKASQPAPTRIEGGNRVVWEMATLDPKALPIFFEVTAETEAGLAPDRELQIAAEAECSENIADPANGRAGYTIRVQPVGPRLVVSAPALHSLPLTAEHAASFQVDVTNGGNVAASDARLEVTLPAGLRFDKAEPQPTSASGQAVVFDLGELARAESKSVAMTVHFDSRELAAVLRSAQPLTFVFKGSRREAGTEVTDSRFEVAKGIETAGQDVAIWMVTEGARVPGEASPQTDVAVVIKIANLGNQRATQVAVALKLGPGLTMAQSEPRPTGTGTTGGSEGGTARWDVGDLGVGMSRTIRSVIHAASIPAAGALVAAVITADGLDIDASNNVASLVWRSPPPPRSRAGTGAASHRWLYFLASILVLGAVVFYALFRMRARRNPST